MSVLVKYEKKLKYIKNLATKRYNAQFKKFKRIAYDLDDFRQEVLVASWKALERYERACAEVESGIPLNYKGKPLNLNGYLVTVVDWTEKRILSRKKPLFSASQEGIEEKDIEHNLAEHVGHAEVDHTALNNKELMNALKDSKLIKNKKKLNIIYLKMTKNLTQKEIGKAMGVSKQYVYQVLKQFKTLIKKRISDSI